MSHITVVTTKRSINWLAEHAVADGERYRCRRVPASWVKYVPLMMRVSTTERDVSHQYVHLPLCDCDPTQLRLPPHGSPVSQDQLLEIEIFDELETDTPHVRKAA